MLNLRKFTYSWLTNRYGTIWNVRKHPCGDAYFNVHGIDFNHRPAMFVFGFPTIANILHDSNCSSFGMASEAVYPCADSYEGFDGNSMNLDMCKLMFFNALEADSHFESFYTRGILSVSKTKASNRDRYSSTDGDWITSCFRCSDSILKWRKIWIFDNGIFDTHFLLGIDGIGNSTSWR